MRRCRSESIIIIFAISCLIIFNAIIVAQEIPKLFPDGKRSVTPSATTNHIWKDVSTRPGPLQDHAMAFDSKRGVLVLFGGESWPTYNGYTWEWSSGTGWVRKNIAGPPARYGHKMVFDSGRNVIVLFGGYANGAREGDTWEYNGVKWTQKAESQIPGFDGPAVRTDHAMVYDSTRGKVVLFGGYGGGSYYLNDTWEWDGTTWTDVSPSGTSPPVRRNHAMAYLSTINKTVLFGGYDGSQRLDDTWHWNGSVWVKKTFPAKPSSRSGHRMVYDSDKQKIVLFGGYNATTYGQEDTWTYSKTSSGTGWEKQSSTGPDRSYFDMAYDSSNSKVLLYGGDRAGSSVGEGDNLWSWNGTIWQTILNLDGPSLRQGTAMAYDSIRKRVVLFGGYDGSNSLGDTWEWDGSGWTRKSTSGPAARRRHAMAFDNHRGVTVMFGGNGPGGTYGSTWEWNGTTWTKKLISGPPARAQHAMVYDSKRKKIVLVGGDLDNGNTWEYDGTSWTEVSTTGPHSRFMHRMAYDSKRGKVVLFGGCTPPYIFSSSNPKNDTWEWDGTTWTQKAASVAPSSASPDPRERHAMAFDSTLNQVILYGGRRMYSSWSSTYLVQFRDTWAWNGTSWTELSNKSYPYQRHDHAMAYDSSRKELVQFGGNVTDMQSYWYATFYYQHQKNNTSVCSPHLINYFPTNVSISPSTGKGNTQTFTATYSDANGASDLRFVYLKINKNKGTSNCAYFRYDRKKQILCLRNKAGSAWLTGGTVTPSATLSNGVVSVDMSKVTVALSGNTLKLKLPCTFSQNFCGYKRIYMMALDSKRKSSGWKQMGNYTVNAAPTNRWASPKNGMGNNQTFVTKYSDANGANDFRYLYFKINNSSSNANCAFFRYRRASNKLDLRTNSGSGWTGGYVVGTSNTLQNSQVQVDVSAVSITKSGNNITMSLPLQFKLPFFGQKKLYMNAFDMNYATPGWQVKGSFIVKEPNYVPGNHAVDPDNGSGGWKTFTATYRDANGADDLAYVYFKIADSVGATGNCVYVRYRCITKKIDLRSSAGGSWIYGPQIGTDVEIKNNMVKINLKNTKVILSGQYLQLKMPCVFRAGFAGTHNIYMYCSDRAKATSNWDSMGTFTVTTPAPETASANIDLSALEVDRGTRLHFNDYISSVKHAQWFIDANRLDASDPSYYFDKRGKHKLEVHANGLDDRRVISGADIFVDENVLKAGDLISWDGVKKPILVKSKVLDAIQLAPENGNEARFIHLNGTFAQGMRIAFNVHTSRNYQFCELGYSREKEHIVWKTGRVIDGREKILSRSKATRSAGDDLLEIVLRPKAGQVQFKQNGKGFTGLDHVELNVGMGILLIPGNTQDLDIVVSRPNK